MLRFLVLFVLFPIIAQAERVVEVRSTAELGEAKKLLAMPDAEPLSVRIAAGEYVIDDTLRVLRSRVVIEGEKGARLRLAAGVNKPVLSVGSQREVPDEAERIEKIRIRNLEIDGNKLKQTSELDPERPWIRNNGIDVRMASDLEIENVLVRDCRSGGLVISWKTGDVAVRDSTFSRSHFDGVAYYDCVRVETIRCAMKLNDAAGVSADNHFDESRFVDCEIVGNGDVGVFMRASREILFSKCLIERSKSWGAFLAHDDSGNGVHGIAFRKCRFLGNDGGVRMASVNEKQSSGNEVIDCAFEGNNAKGRANIDTAGSPVRAEGNVEDR